MSVQIPVKKFWNTGDTITADKLTQMGVLAFATIDENEKLILKITWQEAVDSMVTRIVVDSEKDGVVICEYYIVLEVIGDSKQNNYIIITQDPGGSTLTFMCSSPNGYPATKEDNVQDKD